MTKTLKPKPSPIPAHVILESLAAKHADDVFVPECKNGPTQSASHLRMDAWAMAKSWSNPRATAYEIKVSRSDFLGDEKWRGYLPYCNVFYFVCPKGVIREDEAPAEAGLIYALGGSRLVTRKKAPFRQVEIPAQLYQYLLMCRTKVQRTYGSAELNNLQFWKNWLAQKEESREIGHEASRGLQQLHKRKVVAVEQKQRELDLRMEGYESIKTFLRSMGVDPDHTHGYQVRRQIEALLLVVPPELDGSLERAMTFLNQFRSSLETIKKKAQ